MEILEKALAMFDEDDKGCYMACGFFGLGLEIMRAHHAGKLKDGRFVPIAELLNRITFDLWNVSTLVERLEWSRLSALSVPHIREQWRQYTAVDIDHFHTEVRSIMDYLAQAVGHAVGRPGNIPGSFRKLRRRIDNYREIIPPTIIDLIAAATWFDEIRAVRDAIVHKGALTLVFENPKDGILFQVVRPGTANMIVHQALQYNQNVVRFDRYCAYYFAHVVWFLEGMFSSMTSEIGLSQHNLNARSYSLGNSVIRGWMLELKASIDS